MPRPPSMVVQLGAVLVVGALLFACSSSSSPSGPTTDGGSSGNPPPPPPGQTPPPPGAADAGDDSSSCPTKYEPLTTTLARWNVGDGFHVSWESNDATCTSTQALVLYPASAMFPPPKRSDDGKPCAPPHLFVQYGIVTMTDCNTIMSGACVNKPDLGGYAFYIDALTDPPPSSGDPFLAAGVQFLCTPGSGCMNANAGDVILRTDGTLTVGNADVPYKKPSIPIEVTDCP